MIKKIIKISFAIVFMLMQIGCKNSQQKLQEYVISYNESAKSFKSENVTLTTARGYIHDNKIELRFETDLKQNESDKKLAAAQFPKLLKEMINKGQIPKELIEEGIQFDAYYLADDNTVFEKQILNKETINEVVK
ncbi:hypothetical protein IR010_04490 [Flavobacterium sp. MR2016-29]|uniref:hypothetical protein n=1 Tax=Flavobacterium sp. MR2016-29 TaxID=2783795 RepID=UPI00188B1E12|nr:hypothetical protein [Flavobacterium sp. MR2016-29]MBF4491789.1 hypothetical protein [Flavobacterium sp. MR2016-29]